MVEQEKKNKKRREREREREGLGKVGKKDLQKIGRLQTDHAKLIYQLAIEAIGESIQDTAPLYVLLQELFGEGERERGVYA